MLMMRRVYSVCASRNLKYMATNWIMQPRSILYFASFSIIVVRHAMLLRRLRLTIRCPGFAGCDALSTRRVDSHIQKTTYI